MSNDTSTEPSAGGGASPSLSDTDAQSGPSYHPEDQSLPSTNDGPGASQPDNVGVATPPTPPSPVVGPVAGPVVGPQPQPEVPGWPLCDCVSSQDALDAAMGKSLKRPREGSNFQGKSPEQSEWEWAGYGIESKVYLNASLAEDRQELRRLGISVHIFGGDHPEASASADRLARALVDADPWETNKSRLVLEDGPAMDGLLAAGLLETVALFKKMPADLFVALHPKEDQQAGTNGGAMGPHKDTVSLKLYWLRLIIKMICNGGAAMQHIRFRIGSILYTVGLPPVMVALAPHFTNYTPIYNPVKSSTCSLHDGAAHNYNALSPALS
jgi:hypothetical protein